MVSKVSKVFLSGLTNPPVDLDACYITLKMHKL